MESTYLQEKNHWVKKRVNNSYPKDDEYSLIQGCGTCDSFDIYYRSQFVMNENTHSYAKINDDKIRSVLEHTPIMAGTLTGSVCLKDQTIQHFYVSSAGTFTFTNVGKPNLFAENGWINLVTGEMELKFNKIPDNIEVKVNYEYNMESINQ